MKEERRVKRSNNRWLAIKYQLQYVASHFSMSTLVLADDMGLLISAAESPYNNEAVAAYCPLNGKPLKRSFLSNIYQAMTGPEATEPPQLKVESFEVNGNELFLAAAGRNMGPDPLGVARAVRGVSRILSAA